MILLEQSRSRVTVRQDGDLDNSTSVPSKFDSNLDYPVARDCRSGNTRFAGNRLLFECSLDDSKSDWRCFGADKKICEKRGEDRKALNQESRRIAFPETLLTKPVGIRKSRTSRWRAAVLILVNLLMVAHFIQWRATRPDHLTYRAVRDDATPSSRARLTPALSFSCWPSLATLVFGRFVCGWGCHILALQDFCALDPEENWPHAAAFSVAAPASMSRSSPPSTCLFGPRRSAVPIQRATGTADPEIHEPSYNR